MKLLLITFFLGVVYSAKLDNTYLPPNSARTAGGNGNFLAAPKSSFIGAGAVHAGSALSASPIPAPVYGAPNGHGSADFRSGAFQNGFGPRPYSAPSGIYGVPGFRNQELVPILKYSNDNDNGNYRYEYETANGILAHEEGYQKAADTQEAQGGYTYTSPEGEQVSIEYVANENGFQARGSHIPTPPPIPQEILKSLQLNAEAEARGIYDDGSYRHHENQLSAEYGAPVIAAKSASKQYLAPRAGQYSSAGIQTSAYQTQATFPGPSNQYLAPRKAGFSSRTGYQY